VVEVTVVVQDGGDGVDSGGGDGDVDDPCRSTLAGVPERRPDVDDDLVGAG